MHSAGKRARRAKRTVELFTNSKLSDLLPVSPLPRFWSCSLIPLTYARVVVLAMRVAGIRSRGCGAFGKIRDPNYWDASPKPSWFPSATRMRGRYIVDVVDICHERPFLSVMSKRQKEKKNRTRSLRRRRRARYIERKTCSVLCDSTHTHTHSHTQTFEIVKKVFTYKY